VLAAGVTAGAQAVTHWSSRVSGQLIERLLALGLVLVSVRLALAV